MSMPLEEHDYIGAMPISSGLNLKATELRLGLPGSESPERESDVGYPLKGLVSGAKRGFSHTINASSGNWVLSAGSGSDTTNTTPSGLLKEAVPPSPKAPVPEKKKPQVSVAPAAKAQVVGWPPIRSFRKNSMAVIPPKNDDDADTKLGSGCLYVKVSMDGAPYLRKVDLKTYSSYMELSSALEKMFSCFTIGQYGSHGVPTRDGLSESRLKDLLHRSEYVLTYEDKDGDWMLVGDVPWVMFTETCKRLRIMKSSDAIGLAPRAMEKCRNRN